mgnify:FL=1
MASTYVNDLRLNEMATGDESGNWGVVTNLNLELIGEALGYGTEGITTNADTHTTTVADGATDPGRAMYIEYTGTLDSACTITIAPNTLNRMHFIENGTSGSQNIIISQGSGANVTIPPGDTKAVYLDGAGSGAAVVDAFASLSVVDLKVQDDLTVTDDLIVGGDIDLEGAIDVNGTANLDVVDIDGAVDMATTLAVAGNVDFNGDLDVDGTSNLDVVDIDGAVDMASTLQVDGAITSSAGATITTADNTTQLTLISTDADANAGPNLDLYRNSSSPADNDVVGQINWFAENDAGEKIEFAEIRVDTSDVSNGSEDTRMIIQTATAGGIGTSRLEILPTETVINQDSVDVDFRVESNGDANMLFVNAGTDSVGIGVDSPEGKFEIEDGGTSKDILQKITLDNDDVYGLVVGNDSYSTTLADGFAVTVGNAGVVGLQARGTSSQLQFRTAGTERARITTTGTLVLGATTSTSTANTFDARDGDGVTAAIVGNNALYVQRGQDTTAGANFIIQANRGSLNSPANSNNGDNCGQILFRAYHTNGHYTSSIIRGIQDGPNGTNDMPGTLQFLTSADGSATPDERMRISPTGQIMFGATSSLAASVIFGFNKSADAFLRTQNNSTGATNPFAIFHANGTGVIGSINCTNSATVYNTSSDYRLKENVRPIENGLDRLNNLNPVKFEWKEDGTSSEGFIAHEAQEVFSDAITGKKDGEEMQGMDYGRITPLLVKAIQEQQEQIEQLKTEIEKLH